MKKEQHSPKPNKVVTIERGPWGRFIFRLGTWLTRLLTKIRYVGQEHIPAKGPYIIAANHQSMFDGLWIMGGIPKAHIPQFSCIAGADLQKNYGLIGRIMLQVGRAILVDRHGNPIRGLIVAKKKLDDDNRVMIHPEGTRTYTGRIGPMKNGAGYLAVKTGAPIVPAYINGAYEIFSRYMPVPYPIHMRRLRRKPLTIEFGKPLDPNDYDDMDALIEALNTWLFAKEDAAIAAKDPALANLRCNVRGEARHRAKLERDAPTVGERH